MSTLLSLIACEATLRFANYPLPRNFGWGPNWAPSAISVPERRNVRILLLGDSQVGSRSDPQDLLPGKLLERALNARPAPLIKGEAACGTLPVLRKGHQSSSEISFEVDTLGAAGWGQDQEFLSLQRLLMHNRKYDMILLWSTPENDIWNNAFPTDWPLNGAAKPTFILTNNGQLRLAPKIDITSRLLDSKYKIYALFARAVNRMFRLFPDPNLPHIC